MMSSHDLAAPVVFIAGEIADIPALVASIPPAWQVHVLQAGQDGVTQMAKALEGANGVPALHVICHGSPGHLTIGTARLGEAQMRGSHAGALAQIGRALGPGAELFVYACDFAAGAGGAAAVAWLSGATGARVAASTRPIGAKALGGTWDLDHQTAPLSTPALTAPDFPGLLSGTTLFGTNSPDSIMGSSADEVFFGMGSMDTISGAGGNDLIYGAGGASAYGPNESDRLFGDGGNDTIYGDIGNATIPSSNVPGNDTLFGGTGDDLLYGEDGDDWLNGGIGADTIDGGAGNDLVSFYVYGGLDSAVTIDLLNGTASGGEATGDVLIGIEHLEGTNWDDVLTGNSADNFLNGLAGADTLYGGDGNDTLRGGVGADQIYGGLGIDWVVYTNSSYWSNIQTTGISVSLGTVVGSTGDALGDVLSGIENVLGSDFADTIIGNAGNNVLDGGGGNDSISGGGRYDTLRGGEGADTLDGGSEGDWATYDTSAFGVNVDLVSGTGLGGDAEGDLLTSIEFLIGSAFNDTLTGNTGGNRLDGADGDDSIEGGDSGDTLYGGAGNDLLRGGTGPDTLYGGADSDWAVYDDSALGVSVDLSILTAQTSAGDAQGDVLEGIENLQGSQSADTLGGDAGANILDGRGGNDLLLGADGDDTLIGGEDDDALIGGIGADELEGGNGTDLASWQGSTEGVTVDLTLLTGQVSAGDASGDVLSGIENLEGSEANDTLIGDLADNAISGAGGDDVLVGGVGADVLLGDDGTDWASYGSSAQGVKVKLALIGAQVSAGDAAGDVLSGIENLEGSLRKDTLIGDTGDNTLSGLDDNDTMDGGGGNDTLNGGFGNDTLRGGSGADALFGGLGLDTANYVNSTLGVTVNLALTTAQVSAGDAGGDVLDAIERLVGSNFNDTLIGNTLANQINGGAGDDTLSGGAGADVLQGGLGSDRLTGGGGRDNLYGGADVVTDVFVFQGTFESAVGANRDTIFDMLLGTDNIDLAAIDANKTLAGNQTFLWGDMTATAFGVWYSAAGSDLLVRADVSGDAAADMEILIKGNGTLQSTDFLL